MTRKEAVKEIEKAFEPAFANYIITALTEGATVSDKKPTTKKDLAVDCISRKSVITIIQNHWWNCRDIDKLVNELPSVTPQEPKWIPVTERLPEDNENVLVSVIATNEKDYFRVGDAWYQPPNGCRGEWKNLMICEEVVAWMPLPKPYKPTDSNCDSCEHKNEVDGSNCYECVKGIHDNYKAESEDKE